jgi:hypothetical protein
LVRVAYAPGIQVSKRRSDEVKPAGRQRGGRTYAVNRSTASDRSGSVTVLVSEELHLGHSNIRFSAPWGRGKLRASNMRVWQLAQ